MDTLQAMRVFTRVAEEGSFTAAAQRLDLTTAGVSRAVASLETRLRARLLNRNTRSVALTEVGERYLARCEQALAFIDEAEAEAADSQVLPSGRLRLHATTSFGQTYLVPAVVSYQRRFPSVSVDLTLSQQVPDMLDEGYDVTVQLSATALPNSAFISQQLGTVHSVLCASPNYLRTHGTPRTVSELAGRTCLQIATPYFSPDRWHLDGPDGTEVFDLGAKAFQVNLAEALALALREGGGIGALPMPTAVSGLRDGSLVRVLPSYRLQAVDAYVLYPSRQYLDAKIRTFVEFLREFVPPILAADDGYIRLSQLQVAPGNHRFNRGE